MTAPNLLPAFGPSKQRTAAEGRYAEVGLGEVDFLLVAVLGAPGSHAALERAQDPITEALAVTPL